MDASLGIQTTPSRIGSQPLKGDDDDNGRSLFAFTYPNLFASMENGEDILMSAVRLMDGMYYIIRWVSTTTTTVVEFPKLYCAASSSSL